MAPKPTPVSTPSPATLSHTCPSLAVSLGSAPQHFTTPSSHTLLPNLPPNPASPEPVSHPLLNPHYSGPFHMMERTSIAPAPQPSAGQLMLHLRVKPTSINQSKLKTSYAKRSLKTKQDTTPDKLESHNPMPANHMDTPRTDEPLRPHNHCNI